MLVTNVAHDGCGAEFNIGVAWAYVRRFLQHGYSGRLSLHQPNPSIVRYLLPQNYS